MYWNKIEAISCTFVLHTLILKHKKRKKERSSHLILSRLQGYNQMYVVSEIHFRLQYKCMTKLTQKYNN